MTADGRSQRERSASLLTVAICTWNRAALLAETLEQLVCLTIPPSVEWELLVVDNNSTDTTPSVLAGFRDRLPLRPLREPRQGKSYALNRAIDEARGHYILWTDDDILVDPGWLAAYHAAFLRWPEAGVFGGPIHPLFEGTPPSWLSRVFPDSWVARAYGARMLGDEPLPLSDELPPFGGNMAVQRDLQLRFEPWRGPRGSHYLPGEETAMFLAMLRAGCHGWYVPDARVRHVVPRSRQTTAHLRRYAQGFGESLGRTADLPQVRTLLGKPLFMIREAIAAEARYRWRRLTAPPQVWVRDLGRAGVCWGKLYGYGRGTRRL